MCVWGAGGEFSIQVIRCYKIEYKVYMTCTIHICVYLYASKSYQLGQNSVRSHKENHCVTKSIKYIHIAGFL